MILLPPLEGLLFDFDGLILDTETPIFKAWNDKFNEYGQQLLLEDWAEILGKSTDDLGPIEDFLDSIASEEESQRIIQQVSETERGLIEKQSPLPGAVELIKRAKYSGKKLGIVSSSDRKWVHGHLGRLGLLDYFDHTSCSDDVADAKPDPALYHLGLGKMGCSPDKVVVLEDSPNGVLAAKTSRLILHCCAQFDHLPAAIF